MRKLLSMGLRAVLVPAAVLVAALAAQAAPISVDAAPWDLADGKSSLSIGGATATAGLFGTLSYDKQDDLGSQASYTGVSLDDELTVLTSLVDGANLGDSQVADGSIQDADNSFQDNVVLVPEEAEVTPGAIPEPTAMMLLGAALLVGAGRLRRRK